MSTRALTRVRQVWDLLTKRTSPEDEVWALSVLQGPEVTLYRGMQRYDRYHCTSVARRFAELEPPAWALKGALLHDCGKPWGYGLFWRVFVVLFPDPDIPSAPRARLPWRWAQQLYRWHGLYGAERARAAGLNEDACTIIRDHHARGAVQGDAPWLAEFQRIDDD
ncbi:HD domain-containing protein [bacterium]|nr:HD domain-containing protein [bacterium]